MAGQDYKRHIPAGGSTRINANGETYIFCKFSDRDVTVDIAGRKVVMRTGSYMEFAPLRGENSAVTIYNDDTDNPAAITLTMGVGTYDEKIIRGEISVVPGVKKADGTWVNDERWDLEAAVSIIDPVPVTYTKNSQIDSVSTSGNATHLALLLDSNEMLVTTSDNQHYRYNIETGSRTTIGSYTIELGSYEVSAFKGTLDSDGNTWISARRKSDKKAAVIKINDSLGVTGAVVAPIEAANFANTSAITCPAFDEAGNLYIIVPTSFYKVVVYKQTDSGLLNIGTIDQTAAPEVARHFHIENGLLVWSKSGTANALAAYKLDTLEQVSPSGLINLEYGGMIVPGQRIYWRAEAIKSFRAYNWYTWTKTATGVFTTCASGYMFRPEKHMTEAGITTEVDSEGRVTVTGQIIRAMLELYLGDWVADDYLDHVYAVTFDNEGGRAPRTIRAGNTTFQGAKIADSFRAIFPQTVTITLDNGLKTKG